MREPLPALTRTRSPRVIGLLGGIGSGKSAVSRLLAEAGAVIVSGDEIGHEALRQPELKARVVEELVTLVPETAATRR